MDVRVRWWQEALRDEVMYEVGDGGGMVEVVEVMMVVVAASNHSRRCHHL